MNELTFFYNEDTNVIYIRDHKSDKRYMLFISKDGEHEKIETDSIHKFAEVIDLDSEEAAWALLEENK